MVKFDVEEGKISRSRWSKWGKSKGQRKLEEEGIQEVPFKELIKMNLPDWHFVLFGIIFSGVIGVLFPLISILFSEVIRVGQSL